MSYNDLVYSLGIVILIIILLFQKKYKNNNNEVLLHIIRLFWIILLCLVLSTFFIRYKSIDKVFNKFGNDNYMIVDKKKKPNYEIVYYKYIDKYGVHNSAGIFNYDKLGYKLHDFKKDSYDKTYNYIFSDSKKNNNDNYYLYEAKVIGEDDIYVVLYSCKTISYKENDVNNSPCFIKFVDSNNNDFKYDEDGTGYFWMTSIPKNYKIWIED